MIQTFDDVLTYINENSHPFFQTPFFRNYLREQQEAHDQESNDKIQYTIMARVFSVALNCNLIRNVWPDATIDRYRTNIDLLGSFIELPFFKVDATNNAGERINDPVINWCRENMRTAPFLLMIRWYLEKSDLSNTNSQLRDTFNQLSELICLYKMDVQPPSRWRLDTFHDFISGIYLERSTENVDFVDNTIKEPYVEGKYTVSQPKDRVTLAKWAGKVRNCVLNYSRHILAHESEIIFIEEEGQPRYTVEIDYGPLKKGHVNIKQLQARGRGAFDTRQDERQLCQSLIENAVGLAK